MGGGDEGLGATRESDGGSDGAGVLYGAEQGFRSQRRLNSCFVPESALISMTYKKKKNLEVTHQGAFLPSPLSQLILSGSHFLVQLKEDGKINDK